MDPRAQLLRAVAGRTEIVFALLFGSRADGRARPDSDWDLAVYVDDTLDRAARFQLRRELAADLEPAIAVDVVVLNDAPPLLGHRALQGQLILDRDHARYVRYFVRTLAESLDLQHARRIHADARRHRLAGGARG